jgi:DNA-binding response OmpR family regulator
MTNGATVLIVEDEQALGQIIKDTLEIRGFEVTHVTDGKLAYETYLTEMPQIIVLDVMLPSVNGLEIANMIRLADKHTPILFLTARSTTEDLILGFKAGGNDYIKKPFDLEELIVRIEALVGKNQLFHTTESTANNLVTIGLFRYDIMRHTLSYNNSLIRLSARESEVLEVLFTHKSQLLTRKALLLQVWHNDDFFSSRSLDVYISKLRRHLNPDPAVKIINHRGFGYKLIC